MYAVIFKAKTKNLDEDYFTTAKKLRNIALSKYNCLEFTSCTEGNNEIAISYWETKQQILAWKNDPDHLAAQKTGKQKWYKSYKVEIVELIKEYESNFKK